MRSASPFVSFDGLACLGDETGHCALCPFGLIRGTGRDVCRRVLAVAWSCDACSCGTPFVGLAALSGRRPGSLP